MNRMKLEGTDTRRIRADGQRNLVALLQAAKEVFAEAGTEAPVRDIAQRAGVGVGTVYRHFPKRSDLIAAVFSHEIDACADAAADIAAKHPPFEAMQRWMQEFVKLAATKRGLAEVLHSGDPAFDFMPVKREQRLFPAFRALFEASVAAGEIRADVKADDLLNAAATLCMSAPDDRHTASAMTALLIDGLRFRPVQDASGS